MGKSDEIQTTRMSLTDPRMTSGQGMSIRRYLATRIPTLKPPMAKAPNPIRLLCLLNFQQWMFFLVRLACKYHRPLTVLIGRLPWMDLGCF